MFDTIDFIVDENDDNVHVTHVQSTNCVSVNVAEGLHNPCTNYTIAVSNNTSDRPHHTNYAIESIRIISFNNWPQFKHQTPQQLAEAGFFYAGYGDEVICFYCNGRLRNWKSNGEPWVQHARWFPYCPFVRIVKGNEFIRTIQDRFSQLDNNPERQTEAIEAHARMELPMVRAVLETGVSRNSVMQVIERRLRETGVDYPNADALMNAVLASNRSQNSGDNYPTAEALLDTVLNSEETRLGIETSQDIPSSREEVSISSGHSRTQNSDLEEEIRQLRQQTTCKICLNAEVGIAFQPCGHICCCQICAPNVQRCPVCRGNIQNRIRVFIP